MSNLIISVGRQFGSGGKEIGKKLAEELSIKCFDKEIIKLAAKDSGIREEMFEEADEKPVNSFLYSIVTHGFPSYTPSLQVNNILTNDKIFAFQANTIKKIASEIPAVIIGRCADDILRDNEKLVKVFIYSDKEKRAERISKIYNISEKESYEMIRRMDKSRSSYYEFFTGKNWGDVSNYDLCIDSSVGIENVVKIIKNFIDIKYGNTEK